MLPPDPLLAHTRSLLEHDRLILERLSIDLGSELLPTIARDDAPGWQGLARRSFDTRCEQLASRVRGASQGIDEVAALLTLAIADLDAPS